MNAHQSGFNPDWLNPHPLVNLNLLHGQKWIYWNQIENSRTIPSIMGYFTGYAITQRIHTCALVLWWKFMLVWSNGCYWNYQHKASYFGTSDFWNLVHIIIDNTDLYLLNQVTLQFSHICYQSPLRITPTQKKNSLVCFAPARLQVETRHSTL